MNICNKKIFMAGYLRGFDPQRSVLSNVRPSSLVITLTGTAIGVEWEGFLVGMVRNDLGTAGARHSLAVFRDV